MGMTSATEALLELAATHVDDNGNITVAQLRSVAPQTIGAVMRYGTPTGVRGCYNLNEFRSTDTDAPAETKVEASTPVKPTAKPVASSVACMDIAAADIPVVDPTYVPHGCYDVVLRVAKSRKFFPVMVVGNSGNGKTLGAEQACAKAKRECIIANITNETAEEDLIGSFTLSNGDMIWKDGPVLTAMRRGAVLVLDEIDQATSRILCLQTIMQNKPYYNKKTNEVIVPKEGFTIVGTANTKGDGEGTDVFVGAQIMNSAFLDRFPITVEQEYPSVIVECKILAHHTDNEKFIDRLIAFGKLSRDAYRDGIIPAPITTRKLVHICQNAMLFRSEKQALQYAINRFNPTVRDALIEIYEKLIGDNDISAFDPAATEDEASA